MSLKSHLKQAWEQWSKMYFKMLQVPLNPLKISCNSPETLWNPPICLSNSFEILSSSLKWLWKPPKSSRTHENVHENIWNIRKRFYNASETHWIYSESCRNATENPLRKPLGPPVTHLKHPNMLLQTPWNPLGPHVMHLRTTFTPLTSRPTKTCM